MVVRKQQSVLDLGQATVPPDHRAGALTSLALLMKEEGRWKLPVTFVLKGSQQCEGVYEERWHCTPKVFCGIYSMFTKHILSSTC